jgi:hypothetical protein
MRDVGKPCTMTADFIEQMISDAMGVPPIQIPANVAKE